MTKKYIVVQGPVATRSGYGDHTRDLVHSLIAMDKYDIDIISLPWGACPMDALNIQNKKDKLIIDRLAKGNITRQPDIFIQVSVPNEFCLSPDGKPMKPGKFNIGVTAGIETNQVPHSFIEGCNRMDLIITTSEHSKDGLVNTKYDRINQQTNQKEGELKLETPIEVLFEGLDLDIFFKTNELDKTVVDELSQIKEKSCYLFVGHWIKGDIGQDRKDVGMMIKTFCETFKNVAKHNKPALLLKTSGAGFSIIDRDECLRKINLVVKPYGDRAPKVYLLHGGMTSNEMNSLYNHPKIKAMISFTKGEGFGRPLMEFGITGKPIIASGWSGQLDFLKPEHCVLLPGQMTKVHGSAADHFILKESQWFTVNYQYASQVIKDCEKNYKKYIANSRKQPQYIKDNFTMKHMTEKFTEIIEKHVKVPEAVALKLPKLKKVGGSNPGQIKLPKLKKVEV
tara:strand:+ start:3458 stop:4813 length:1356 start_codon:yes stop_codon:yes gene_type:complete